MFGKVIDRKINQYADYFITASSQTFVSLTRGRHFEPKKFIQIYNTIEESKIIKSRKEICKLYNVDSGKTILCEVAFLSERKGQMYILRALHKIQQRYPDIFAQLVLFLVGDGEDYYKLEKYCDLKGFHNVIFTGYQNNYIDFIACSDIFILPSVGHEDMPLVILSAMKLGKPIISTDVAGISEEIEDLRSGILLKVENLDSLYLEIVKLFRDSEVRQYYGINAQRRFEEHFSRGQVYGKIKSLYAKLAVFT